MYLTRTPVLFVPSEVRPDHAADLTPLCLSNNGEMKLVIAVYCFLKNPCNFNRGLARQWFVLLLISKGLSMWLHGKLLFERFKTVKTNLTDYSILSNKVK